MSKIFKIMTCKYYFFYVNLTGILKMFCLFFDLINSVPDVCSFKPTFPAGVKDMKLRYVQVMTRHGQRVPNNLYDEFNSTAKWTCDSDEALAGFVEASPETHYRMFKQVIDPRYVDLPINCRAGDLTLTGMNQHFNLGQEARKHYVNELNFLPEEMDPTNFMFISSPYERCVKSAQSFIAGLYPPRSDNEVINIQTAISGYSTLIPGGASCKEFSDASRDFYRSNETKKFLNENWPKLGKITKIANLTKRNSHLSSICDYVIGLRCAFEDAPELFTDEVFNTCQKVLAYYYYDLYAFRREIAFAPTLRHMLKMMDQVIGSRSEIKFTHISSHDLTMAAFMGFIGLKRDYVPPYASAMVVELWEDKVGVMYIRIIFNGEVLTIPELGESLIKFDKFRQWAEPMAQHCLEVSI